MALLLATGAVLAQDRAPEPSRDTGASAPATREVLLAVTVNELDADPGTVFLLDGDEHLYAPLSFLSAQNLRPGRRRVLGRDGAPYVDLVALPGVSYQWNHEREELAIHAGAEAFVATRINMGAQAGRAVDDYASGAYLNYTLSASRDGASTLRQGAFDLSAFRGRGLVTSGFAAGANGATRLMSSYQRDDTDKLTSLRLGDSINNTGAWGRGVLFGGIQFGSNFAVRPDFIAQAMPSVSGSALLPSTVDVYVNNVLRARQTVEAGPFAIHELPAITGAGDMQVVVRDVLGREQLISQPFFASPSLLRPGLVDQAYELGWLRQDYSVRSNAYRDPFASATYRRGLREGLTGEARVELQRELVTGGATATVALPGMDSVLGGSFVLSRQARQGGGALASLDYSYEGRSWSANLRGQWESAGFRQLGSDPANLLRSSGSAQLGMPLAGGTLSVSWLTRSSQGADPVTAAPARFSLLGLSYARRLGDAVHAAFTLNHGSPSEQGSGAALVLTVLTDPRHFGSVSLNQQGGRATAYSQYQQVAPRGEGDAYRLADVAGGGGAEQEASYTRKFGVATVELEAMRQAGTTNTRVNVDGAVALLGGKPILARHIDAAFAVVDTGGLADVPVYLENQLVARTDAHGRALLGELRPYQDNRVSLDPLSLPMEAVIDELERNVVPRAHGGVLVEFGLRLRMSATLSIVQPDGSVLPPWTPVAVDGVAGRFVTGLRGEVFVELPKRSGNQVTAYPVAAPPCVLQVDLAPGAAAQSSIGPLPCAATP